MTRESASERLLFLLLAARLIFHSVYVPVFEGPDEPFHVGRAAAFADSPIAEAISGSLLSGRIVSAIRAHPCGPDLARAFGCRAFRGDGAFDVMGSSKPVESIPASAVNYEAHQPPLYYLLVSPVLFVVGSPERRTLAMRLVSVGLVLFALAFPLRRLSLRWPETARLGLLLLLLLPGAAESLARASNDAAVFLWTAIVIERTARGGRSVPLILLLAAGPLLKLTAFPVVAVSVVALWIHGRRSAAVAGALASLSVIPVQLLRGWGWGGTYELNRASGALPASMPVLSGVVRSLYTFAKTVFWLGEWSFFRAPGWLVAWWFGLIVLLVAGAVWGRKNSSRDRAPEIPSTAHLAGLVVASAGVLVVIFSNARLFGDWGGLGGWYVWGWIPWIFAAAEPAMRLGRVRTTILAAFALVANSLWIVSAARLYGP